MLGLGPFEVILVLAFLAVPAALVFLAYRFARAQQLRSAQGSGELEEVNARLGRLEEQFQGLVDSVEQIAEGQRFTTTVLAELPPPRKEP